MLPSLSLLESRFLRLGALFFLTSWMDSTHIEVTRTKRVLTESFKLIKADRTSAFILCDAPRVEYVTAVQEPDLLSVDSAAEGSFAVGTLAIEAGDTSGRELVERLLLVLPVFLDQVHGAPQDVLEVALDLHLVCECFLEFFVLHHVAHLLQELDDLSEIDILAHPLHEVLILARQELLKVLLLLRLLFFTGRVELRALLHNRLDALLDAENFLYRMEPQGYCTSRSRSLPKSHYFQ